MLELKSGPGWPGVGQHGAVFSPVQLALGVEAGTEEMLEEGRGEGRRLGWNWGHLGDQGCSQNQQWRSHC